MKYFNISDNNSELWHNAHVNYRSSLEQISSKLPKKFLSEYLKHGFGDSTLIKIEISNTMDVKKSFVVQLFFRDYFKDEIIHLITFYKVSVFKTNLDFINTIGYDWLISEILEINESRMSFELILLSDCQVYIEFKNLKYSKIHSIYNK